MLTVLEKIDPKELEEEIKAVAQENFEHETGNHGITLERAIKVFSSLADDPTHRGIVAQAVSVVHVLVAGETTID